MLKHQGNIDLIGEKWIPWLENPYRQERLEAREHVTQYNISLT